MAAKTRTLNRNRKEIQGFSRLSDPLEINNYLGRAIETRCKIDVRLNLGEIRFTGHLLDTSDREQGLHIDSPDSISAEQKELPTGGAMVIAFLRGQVLICIQAEKAGWKDEGLIVTPPWNVFKLQRRKEPRFGIPAAYELTVSIEAVDGVRKRLVQRVLDISMSGMGFQVVSPEEALYFKKGLFLRRMVLILENRQIFIDARVCSAMPLVNNPRQVGFKIGVEFMRISPVDASFIASYVVRGLAQTYS